MRLVKSLRKRTTGFFFKKLVQAVKDKKIRPFCVDEQGLWFETKYGFSVYSNLKDRILELDVNPNWEEMESSFVFNNVREGDTFVDVGANIGYFSMLAAQQKAGKVLAIEPAPKIYDMLNMNVKHNMFDNVIETFNLALSGKSGTLRFVSSLGPKSHLEYTVDNEHKGLPAIKVKVTTLDDLLRDKKEIRKIDFIKVDIEGAEYDFLLGADKTIEIFKPMILMEIEEHRLIRFNATAEKIFGFMNRLGYNYLSVTEDAINEGCDYEEDLKKGRDFIFYTSKTSPRY